MEQDETKIQENIYAKTRFLFYSYRKLSSLQLKSTKVSDFSCCFGPRICGAPPDTLQSDFSSSLGQQKICVSCMYEPSKFNTAHERQEVLVSCNPCANFRTHECILEYYKSNITSGL